MPPQAVHSEGHYTFLMSCCLSRCLDVPCRHGLVCRVGKSRWRHHMTVHDLKLSSFYHVLWLYFRPKSLDLCLHRKCGHQCFMDGWAGIKMHLCPSSVFTSLKFCVDKAHCLTSKYWRQKHQLISMPSKVLQWHFLILTSMWNVDRLR